MQRSLSYALTAAGFMVLTLASLGGSLFQRQVKQIADLKEANLTLAQSVDTIEWKIGKEQFRSSSSYEYEEFKGKTFVRRSRVEDNPERVEVLIPDIRAAGFVMASSSGALTIFPGYYVEKACNQYGQQCTFGPIIYQLDYTQSPLRFIALKNASYQESYYFGFASEGGNGDWLLVCEDPDQDGEVRQLSFLNLTEDRWTKLKRLPQQLSYTREKIEGRPSPVNCPSGAYASHKMGDGAEVEIFRAEDFPLPHRYTYTRTPIAKITAFIDRVEESKDLIAY